MQTADYNGITAHSVTTTNTSINETATSSLDLRTTIIEAKRPPAAEQPQPAHTGAGDQHNVKVKVVGVNSSSSRSVDKNISNDQATVGAAAAATSSSRAATAAAVAASGKCGSLLAQADNTILSVTAPHSPQVSPSKKRTNFTLELASGGSGRCCSSKHDGGNTGDGSSSSNSLNTSSKCSSVIANKSSTLEQPGSSPTKKIASNKLISTAAAAAAAAATSSSPAKSATPKTTITAAASNLQAVAANKASCNNSSKNTDCSNGVQQQQHSTTATSTLPLPSKSSLSLDGIIIDDKHQASSSSASSEIFITPTAPVAACSMSFKQHSMPPQQQQKQPALATATIAAAESHVLQKQPNNNSSSNSNSSSCPPTPEELQAAMQAGLLEWKDMPKYLQFNPYVLEGYRPLQTFRGCILSLFYWHNETINILTHAIPIVYILAIVPGLMPWEQERFLSFCHVFGSVAPWCGSFVYHLFMNIERGEKIYYQLLKLDMVGIWVSQSFGALPLVTAATFCFNYKWKWFIILTYCLVSLWGLYKALTAASPWQRRLCFALPFTMRSILTFFRTFNVVGEGILVGGSRLALTHVYLQDVVSIFGGAIGAMRIPEKWFPGLVDFYLNSHNIMHVLVVVAVYSMHKATIRDFEWMATTTCNATYANQSETNSMETMMLSKIEL